MTINTVIAKSRFLAQEAATKVTTYVAILIASAGELRDQWQQLSQALPDWAWLHSLEQHAFSVLGAAMVYARLRRVIRENTPASHDPP